MTKILVTRPEGKSRDRFVTRLQEAGFEPLLLPLTSIEQLSPVASSKTYQAYLFTSSNAVASAGDLSKDGLCLTVGEATALALKEKGFSSVLSADGNVNDLVALAMDRLDRERGPLLYLRGEAVAGDLVGLLETNGFQIDSSIVYRANPLEVLPRKIKFEINQGSIEIATFLSPLAAEIFKKLVYENEESIDLTSTRAICMSRSVADALEGLDWQDVAVAKAPNLEELMPLL